LWLIGQVRHKTQLHEGEQAAIFPREVWQRAQVVLRRNGRGGGPLVRNQFGALLKGLLHCVPCGCAMTPSQTTRKGNWRYRYYTCMGAQKRGWHSCPSKSIPAGEIEKFVVEQIRTIGKDPAVWRQTFTASGVQGAAHLEELAAERRGPPAL
jgi:site-specific DNA recombinase